MTAGGVLYGTTSGSATDGSGTVFMLSPPAAGGAWTETVLHQFGATPRDAVEPLAGVIANKNGAIFGTAYFGGMGNYGAVYEITK